MPKKNKIHPVDFRNRITWNITERCNFNCSYCLGNYNKKILEPIDLVQLSEGINYLQEDWFFLLTGGEPFLEKNIIDICRIITEKHYLGLITNLSTANVFDFADHIDPEKCLYIYTSVHPTEREKKDLKLRAYIEKMHYLQNKGFNVIAYYVTYPGLFDRMKSDFAFLRSNGIQNISIKVFIGMYDGKYYPSSYTSEQIEFLGSLGAEFPELDVLTKTFNYYGKLCYAGNRSFVMDRNGNLKKCFNYYDRRYKDYGNLFEKSKIYDIGPNPCLKTQYPCPQECITNSLNTKANIISILHEEYNERSLILKKDDTIKELKLKMRLKCKKIMSKKFIINKFWQMIGALEKAGIPFDKIKLFCQKIYLIITRFFKGRSH